MLTDESIIYASYESEFVIISIYVNDLLITVTLMKLIKKVKKVKTALCKKFNMHDLRKTRMIINMRIIRYKTKRLLIFN